MYCTGKTAAQQLQRCVPGCGCAKGSGALELRMKSLFASRSPTKTRKHKDGSRPCSWAWDIHQCALGGSLGTELQPYTPPANGCHRLPHRLGKLSERVLRYIAPPPLRSARSGHGNILSACEDQAQSSGHRFSSDTGRTRNTDGRGRALFANRKFIGVIRTTYGTCWCQKESKTSHTFDSGVIQPFANTESPSNRA
jgi:hypothetical protein